MDHLSLARVLHSWFYHVGREQLNVITGLECCTNKVVFTGQPNSPITNHTEFVMKQNGGALPLLKDDFVVHRA